MLTTVAVTYILPRDVFYYASGAITHIARSIANTFAFPFSCFFFFRLLLFLVSCALFRADLPLEDNFV